MTPSSANKSLFGSKTYGISLKPPENGGFFVGIYNAFFKS
tara:strand:- start:340 stop:459 length:120 start_codon:yes stop_codon:yes gene_type:complete